MDSVTLVHSIQETNDHQRVFLPLILNSQPVYHQHTRERENVSLQRKSSVEKQALCPLDTRYVHVWLIRVLIDSQPICVTTTTFPFHQTLAHTHITHTITHTPMLQLPFHSLLLLLMRLMVTMLSISFLFLAPCLSLLCLFLLMTLYCYYTGSSCGSS